MKTFTYKDLMSWKPCYEPNRYLSEDWSGTAVDILKKEVIPFNDRLWVVLRTDLVSDKLMRLFAVYSYRQTLEFVKNPDPRSVESANVAEAFALGQTTHEKLDAAHSDARSAAHSAIWSDAHSAIWSDAHSAIWSDARSADWSDARSADWSAIWSAHSAAWSAHSAAHSAAWSAHSAARSAAWSAHSDAWSAAHSAAWSVFNEKLKIKLIEMIEAEDKEAKI